MSQAKVGPRPRAASRPVRPPRLPDAGNREQMLLAGLLLAIGGIWVVVPLLALVTGAPPPLPDLGTFGICVLLAVGAGQTLWGLEVLLRRKTLIIDQDAVHVSVRSLLGVRRWSEPLANYRGLRHRRQRIRHRYGWRIVHRLQLAHPDPAKEIDLIRTQDERRIAAARQEWADWLGLPSWSTEGAASRRPPPDRERRAVEPNGVPSF